MSTLDDSLPVPTRALLERYGFDAIPFDALRRRLSAGRAEEADNRVSGRLEPPLSHDITALPALHSDARRRLSERGLEALVRGEVAAIVLAGGMATRFGGVVKAAVEVSAGRSFLDLKLRDFEQLAERAGSRMRVLLMTSFATHHEVTQLAARFPATALQVETFPQLISLRLFPSGELFRDRTGNVSPYAPGHGDLVDALRRADLLRRLRESGVKHVFMSNVDNLAATLDPAVIGAHLESRLDMTFEVAALYPGDKGGVPTRLDGRLQVVEALRYPQGFVESSIPWFSTNSFMLTLASLDREFPLEWFRVTKQVDHQPAVQFERLINQLTAFLPAHALAIERTGLDCRFLPVKDPDELRSRLPDIQRVLSSRGTL
jgi:UTP--glucose-1-phosphate uridylyltransferase